MALDLSAKIGPLPAWAWGGIVGVGVVGFSWWRSSTTAATTADNTPVIDGIDGAFGGASGGGVNGAPGGGTTPTNPNADDGLTDVPSYGDGTTNYDSDYQLPDYSGVDFNDNTSLETWVARAVLWLSGQGNSPAVAQQQINDYLSGAAVPTGQDTLVQRAIAHFGAPPMGGINPGDVDLSGTGPTPQNTPKGPDRPGYYQAWSNQTHSWQYFKNTPSQSDLSKSTNPTAIPFSQRSRLTVPELPPKPGYNRGWNEKTRSWFYYKPA